MHDQDIESRIRSGSWMVTLGVMLLVASIFGQCTTSAARRRDGFSQGEQPFLMLGLAGAIALITVGQVRKSNARRAAEERFTRENFVTVKAVPDPDAPGGPFRGAMKEVEVVDPVVAQMEADQRALDHRRGTRNLIIGGVLVTCAVSGIVYATLTTASSTHAQVQRVFTALGLSVFPFGFGLFFAIRGLLQRNR